MVQKQIQRKNIYCAVQQGTMFYGETRPPNCNVTLVCWGRGIPFLWSRIESNQGVVRSGR